MSDDSPPPGPARRGPRRLRAALLAALVSTLASLLVAELTVRALGLAPPPRGASKSLKVVVENVPEERAPGVHRRLVPGAEESHVYAGEDGAPDRTITYRINSLGLRGPETTPAPAPGTLRVAVVGDSFVFGTAIQEDETLSAALERELRGALPGREVEVLNGGIEAINLPQAVRLLENRVARLAPDLVLLCAYINDASGLGVPEGDPTPEARRRLEWIERLGLTSGVWAEGEERSAAQRRTMALRRRSALVDWLAHRLYLRLYGPVSAGNYHRDWAEGSPGLEAVRGALARAADLAERAGFELVVTMYPALQGLDGRFPYTAEHARFRAAVEDAGLRYLDLLEALRGQEPRALHAHAHDAHPNGRCNELAARHLAPSLAAALAGR